MSSFVALALRSNASTAPQWVPAHFVQGSVVPSWRVPAGAALTLQLPAGASAARVRAVRRERDLLLLDDNNQTLAELLDCFDALGEPVASVSLQAAAATDTSATATAAPNLDVSSADLHSVLGGGGAGASLAELGGLALQPSMGSLLLSGAAMAAGAAAGGGGSGEQTASVQSSSTPDTSSDTPAPDLNATGNAQANRLTGSASANVLDGAGGDDTLEGGCGF
jgi:hypothetical protein